MVVDDSAVIRGLLTRALEEDPGMTVVSSVSNGELALRAVERTDVEIVVLDIEMPLMDGMTALPLLLKAKPGIQVIMASTLTRKNAEISLKALANGAADYVAKPTSTSEIHSASAFKQELRSKVKAVATAARAARKSEPLAKGGTAALTRVAPKKTQVLYDKPVVLRAAPLLPPEIIAIGSSTGGPQALLRLFEALGSEVRQPVLITQHMPPTFTTLLAEHISRASRMLCTEGRDGEPIVAGRAYIAPGDHHMTAEVRDGRKVIGINQKPPENFCRPAVDPMLRSLGNVFGARLLVIILTGMGSDGRKGAAEVVAAGGTVIAQDEATSVVWGMPGAVATAGLCSAVLPLHEIGPYVRKLAVRSAA